MYGLEKYKSEGSWKEVENAQDRYWAAMQRHVDACFNDEELDPESGLPHLSHALCNIMFLLWFEIMEDREDESIEIQRLQKKIADLRHSIILFKSHNTKHQP